MQGIHWFLVVNILIEIPVIIRVIMRRLPVGVALGWLAVIVFSPILGVLLYLMLGETRLGRTRSDRLRRLHEPYEAWLERIHGRYPNASDALPAQDQTLARLIQNSSQQPVLPKNELELIAGADAFFDRLIADIDGARLFCHLEFYIWADGGRVDAIQAALERAGARGVACRVMIDALGSARFLRSPSFQSLRSGRIDLRAALPVGLFRGLFRRLDLRLHRKIVVIDGRVGYTGSQNMVDPRLFKQGAGVGEWVDAMVRVAGPAVEAMNATFLEDWEQETGHGLHEAASALETPEPGSATAAVQVVATGPNLAGNPIESVLLQASYDAEREIVFTTPYFVPSEPMIEALRSAAYRGVDVVLVLPARIDSHLVNLASRAFLGDLAEAGVRICQFEGGLLHTKSITIDGKKSLFGSVNLDPRSMRLNFEVTLAIFDAGFTRQLRALQDQYIEQAREFDWQGWLERPFGARLLDNTARLIGPLL